MLDLLMTRTTACVFFFFLLLLAGPGSIRVVPGSSASASSISAPASSLPPPLGFFDFLVDFLNLLSISLQIFLQGLDSPLFGVIAKVSEAEFAVLHHGQNTFDVVHGLGVDKGYGSVSR